MNRGVLPVSRKKIAAVVAGGVIVVAAVLMSTGRYVDTYVMRPTNQVGVVEPKLLRLEPGTYTFRLETDGDGAVWIMPARVALTKEAPEATVQVDSDAYLAADPGFTGAVRVYRGGR